MQILTAKQLRIATYKLAAGTIADGSLLLRRCFCWRKTGLPPKRLFAVALIALVPNLMFALVFFQVCSGDVDANEMLAQLRKANTVKLLLTIVLFSVVFITTTGQ